MGGPKTGKTTLANRVDDRLVFHTDDYRHLPWSDVPHAIIRDLAGKDTFILEGVQVPRTLRKGLSVDAIVYMTRPKVRDRRPRQSSMDKAVRTVFDEWRSTNPGVPVFIEGAREGINHGNF
jgi:hypothetical protein